MAGVVATGGHDRIPDRRQESGADGPATPALRGRGPAARGHRPRTLGSPRRAHRHHRALRVRRRRRRGLRRGRSAPGSSGRRRRLCRGDLGDQLSGRLPAHRADAPVRRETTPVARSSPRSTTSCTASRSTRCSGSPTGSRTDVSASALLALALGRAPVADVQPAELRVVIVDELPAPRRIRLGRERGVELGLQSGDPARGAPGTRTFRRLASGQARARRVCRGRPPGAAGARAGRGDGARGTGRTPCSPRGRRRRPARSTRPRTPRGCSTSSPTPLVPS